MASSDSGSQGGGTGTPSPANRGSAALKIPFFWWRSRKYFLFIEFQTRRYHQHFEWQRGAALPRLPQTQGAESQGFQVLAAVAPRNEESGEPKPAPVGTVDINNGSVGVAIGFGSEETTNGVAPPDPGEPKDN